MIRWVWNLGKTLLSSSSVFPVSFTHRTGAGGFASKMVLLSHGSRFIGLHPYITPHSLRSLTAWRSQGSLHGSWLLRARIPREKERKLPDFRPVPGTSIVEFYHLSLKGADTETSQFKECQTTVAMINPHGTTTNALNNTSRGGPTSQVTPFPTTSWPIPNVFTLHLGNHKSGRTVTVVPGSIAYVWENGSFQGHASPWGAAHGFFYTQFRMCQPTAWEDPSVVSWSLIVGETEPFSWVNLMCWVSWKSIHPNAGKEMELLRIKVAKEYSGYLRHLARLSNVHSNA